jgi:type I restriction enzyme, S subunit
MIEGLKYEKLGNLVKIVGGGTPSRAEPSFWNGVIPWASVKDFNEIELTSTLERITDLGVENSATSVIEPGAVIVPTRMALGKAAINTIRLAINQDLKALLPVKRLHNRYLLHFILSVGKELEEKGVGATVKGIKLDVLQDILVPLPSFEIQSRIATILDKADAIRRKRRQGLAQIDALLRATFLEMFGDPATNPKGFDIAPVQRVLSRDRAGTQSGPFGAALKKHEYVSGGIPVWGIENIESNTFNPKARLFVTEQKFAELERYAVRDGDVLISRAGTVGRMCIAHPGVEKSVLSTNLVRVSLDRRKMLPEYFVTLFTSFPDRLSRLRANKKDNAFSFLNPGTLRVLEIPQPRIDLQVEFARRVKAFSAAKQLRAEAIEMADELFSSLSRRAFRGEL